MRRDIADSLANTLDSALLNGNGTAPNVSGLFHQLTGPTADSVTETFATFLSTISNTVDGLFSYDLQDLRVLIGLATWRGMVSTFATNEDATSAADYVRSKVGVLRMSNKVAAPDADNQSGIVRLGNRPMCAVLGTWGGVEFIRDPYTSAGKSQVSHSCKSDFGRFEIAPDGRFQRESISIWRNRGRVK